MIYSIKKILCLAAESIKFDEIESTYETTEFDNIQLKEFDSKAAKSNNTWLRKFKKLAVECDNLYLKQFDIQAAIR